MGIDARLGIEEKGNARAYKSNGSKSFGYDNNNIIIIKVKN